MALIDPDSVVWYYNETAVVLWELLEIGNLLNI